MKFVPWKDKKRVAADLKSIYSAPSEEAALLELEIFKEKWDSKYPTTSIIWQRNWAGITPCLGSGPINFIGCPFCSFMIHSVKGV